MDFLHPDKKRKKKLRLFVGYALMGIALSIATFIVVVFTMGFDIDPETGEVIRKGLLIVDSQPATSEIKLNGEVTGTTKARYNLPAGKYTVELNTEGYRTWQRTFDLEANSIIQLVYPFLFPNELTTEQISRYSTEPTLVSQSPDRQWYVIGVPGKLGTFDVVNLISTENTSERIALPSDVLSTTGKNHSLSEVEWSTDNQHLLIKHSWNGGSEFIVIDRANPLQSVNITKAFPRLNISQMRLRDKLPDQFYIYNKSSQTITQANLNSQESTVLVKGALSFKPYKDQTLLYTKQSAEKESNTVDARIWEAGEDYFIRRLPKSSHYMLDLAEYERELYVVVGSQADGKAYIYKNPVQSVLDSKQNSPYPLRLLVAKNGWYTSFSNNARFISLQGAEEMVVFDAERTRQYRYNHGLVLADGQKVSWMDGHRLLGVSDGSTVVFDFDGSNKQTLIESDKPYLPVFDRDYERLYLMRSSGKAYELLRAPLLITP